MVADEILEDLPDVEENMPKFFIVRRRRFANASCLSSCRSLMLGAA